MTRRHLLMAAGFLLLITADNRAVGQDDADTSVTTVTVTTDRGSFDVELYPTAAPITVANFLHYVDSGDYEGGTFFRTVTMDNQPNNDVKIEVIQGGVHPWKDDSASDPIPLERTSDTGIRHVDGAISMARGAPDSATNSFFICIGDQPELDFGGHRNPDGQGFAAFGKVVNGMDVVRAIQTSPAQGQALVPQIGIIQIARTP